MNKIFFSISFFVCLFASITLGANCDAVGEKLQKIKVIPFKGETVSDSNYYDMMNLELNNLFCSGDSFSFASCSCDFDFWPYE